MTANGWTIKAATADQLPAWGATSSAFLESAINTATSLQLDPTGRAMAGSETDYWLDLPIRAIHDGTTPIAASQLATSHVIASTSTFARTRIFLNAAAGFTIPQGLAFDCHNNGASAGSIQNLNTAGSSNGIVQAMFGDWQRLTVHYHVGTGAAGYVEIFLNGEWISKATGDTTTSAITWTAQALSVAFPAWPGVKWQVAGPIQSWSGTDFPLRPTYEIDNVSTSLVTKVLKPIHTVASGANTQGHSWVSSATGNTSVTPTDYGSSGTTPLRSRTVFASAGTGQSITVDQIGTLPYDDNGGWGHVVLSDVMVNANAAVSLVIGNSDDSATLFQFDVTTTPELKAAYNGGTSAKISTWDNAKRYCLALHLNRDGRAAISMFDLTTANGSDAYAKSTIARSGTLPNWTPQPLGKFTILATPTASASVETGYVAVCRRPTFAACDSLSSADYTGVTPNIRVANYIGRCFGHGQENQTITGGWYPMKEIGMPKRIVIAPLGAGGLYRRDFTQTCLSGMKHSHGIELLLIDGGSINDIGDINSGADAQVLATLRGATDKVLELSFWNHWKLFTSTMLPRTYTTGSGDYTANELAAISKFNAMLRRAWDRFSVSSFALADIEADKAANPTLYPDTTAFWSDQTHPNAATATAPGGAGVWARRIVQTAVTRPDGMLASGRLFAETSLIDKPWLVRAT